MAVHLSIYLAKNLACIEQMTYTTEAGTLRRYKDAGNVWLKVLVQVANAADSNSHEYFGGWRWLAKEAGTTEALAKLWIDRHTANGLLKELPSRRQEGQKYGKPSRCWQVTLPNCPAPELKLWEPPTKPEAVAQVHPIDKPTKRKQATQGQSFGVVLGNVVAQIQPSPEQEPAPQEQPAASLSEATKAAMSNASTLILVKARDLGLSTFAQTLQVDKAQGSWGFANYSKQGKGSAVEQIEAALGQGLCTDTEAAQYLACFADRKQDLCDWLNTHRGA
jgi:hypothetical protein